VKNGPLQSIEKDLKKIAMISEQLRDENFRFRRFIKERMDDRKLDLIVKDLYHKIASEIDCQACGNCCQVSFPTLTKTDVNRLAKALGLKSAQFQEQFIKLEDGDMVLKAEPCPFLNDKRCSHYEARPTACKSYPHLHKSGFSQRSFFVLENFGVCPIVFNVVQRLKNIIWRYR